VYRSILFLILPVPGQGDGWILSFFFAGAIILIPRIIFSIFLVASIQDYNRHRETSVKRKVNMSFKFATVCHKFITTIFSVLNVRESTVVTVLQRLEYVTLQLLGHNYSERTITIYSEIESIATFLKLLQLYFNSQDVLLYIASRMIIYAMRITIMILQN